MQAFVTMADTQLAELEEQAKQLQDAMDELRSLRDETRDALSKLKAVPVFPVRKLQKVTAYLWGSYVNLYLTLRTTYVN